MRDKINMLNYQEWFIDYSDGTLSHSEIEQVYLFLSDHPQLMDEFYALSDLPVIEPETVSLDKSSLIQNIEPIGPINADNYQEYFIAYHSGDLSSLAHEYVQSFIEAYPFTYKEYKLYAQTFLQADNGVNLRSKRFLYKGKLRKLRLYGLTSTAAAACIALMIWFSVPGKPVVHESQTAVELISSPATALQIPKLDTHPHTVFAASYKPTIKNRSEFTDTVIAITPPDAKSILAIVNETAKEIQNFPDSPLTEPVTLSTPSNTDKGFRMGALVDIGANLLADLTDDAVVLRVDRDESGTAKKIRLNTPFFNYKKTN